MASSIDEEFARFEAELKSLEQPIPEKDKKFTKKRSIEHEIGSNVLGTGESD